MNVLDLKVKLKKYRNCEDIYVVVKKNKLYLTTDNETIVKFHRG